jgi:hypothetical protein
MAQPSVRFGVRSRKLNYISRSLDGWPKIYYLEFLRASESTISRWSRLHLQSLAPTNRHWARVVDHGPFFLYIIRRLYMLYGIRKACAPAVRTLKDDEILSSVYIFMNCPNIILIINMKNFFLETSSEATKKNGCCIKKGLSSTKKILNH